MLKAGVDFNKQQSIVDSMAKYVVKSRADNTVKKYSNCFKLFSKYCEENKLVSKPAPSIVVAMYLTHLMESGKSEHVVASAVYAIKWMHSINDLNDPTDSQLVSSLLEASKRIRSTPVKKKDIVDSDMLRRLCALYLDTVDLVTLRDLAMILLSYAGFLRFNELSSLRCCDIVFYEDHFIVKISKSKTDIYRKGKEIAIAKGVSNACPFLMLQRYIAAAGLALDSQEFLFRPIFKSKGVASLVKINKQLSYTRARECIVSKLRLVAPDLNLGTHSLRASGATAAANAPGVSDRCLKRHGRWMSDQAKDGYILDSLDSRLHITKKKLNL